MKTVLSVTAIESWTGDKTISCGGCVDSRRWKTESSATKMNSGSFAAHL